MTTDERFDRIERSIETLTQYVLDFRQETASRFQTIETRLDVLSATVASIDSRFPSLTKAIFDFGALSSQLVREQSRQKERVEKLEAA
jgi:vacuolar-type H+-ATPase subunit I/STV1